MRGLFWNIRGMGKKGRTRCIQEKIQEELNFIGIQETKSVGFNESYLDSLTGSKHFCWKWLPTKKTAGGILMGVNDDIFEMINWEVRNFSVSCVVVNKIDKLKSRICTVYGPPYEEKKQEFLDELCELGSYGEAILIGGDFNLVRSKKDKSNEVVEVKWCEKFNEWIDKNSLLEIKLFGRSFTLSNNQEHAVMSHIDRVFCST
jgi:exonuclease III